MDLTWLGTAGFIVKGKEGEFAFDPFLSRGRGEKSPFTAKAFANSRAIFVGHGHFDHTYDLPHIASETDLKIYAPGLTGQILKMRGVPGDRLFNATNKEVLLKPFNMRAFKSSHVLFDGPLIASTLKRMSHHGLKCCAEIAGLALGWPVGMVQTYYFEVDGKKVLFASSAGFSKKELETYRKLEVDYFLAPLQGHSDIQEIAAQAVSIINPKTVIPHHHDDFYPPLSQSISADVFREDLKKHSFKGDVLEIPLFKSALV